MTRILIPQLDANVIEVTLSCWRKKVGDEVKAGECLAELATDKAAYELEAPESGILLAIYAEPKSIIPTGYIVGVIGLAGEQDETIEQENAAHCASTCGAIGSFESRTPVDRGTRIRATPRVRRLAREQGIDLSKVQSENGAELIDEQVIAPYLKS